MAGAQQLKTPPVLESEDNYVEWSNDVKIWQLYTDLDKKKQGPAMYLTLKGRARECIRELSPAEIGADDGVDKIIAKLDTLFMKDKNTRAYLAFKEFYDYRRPSGVNITDFIVRFEYLYHKLKQFEMKLPEGVQAFFLLNAANVSEDNEKLARATIDDLTYSNMKEKIRKIFGNPVASEDGATPAVKSEPVFTAEHETAFQNSAFVRNRGRGYGFNRGRGRGNWSSRGRGKNVEKSAGYYNDTRGYGTNPRDRSGNVLRCYHCESTKHLANSCPHGPGKSISSKDNSKEEVHITLFNISNGPSDMSKEEVHVTLFNSKQDLGMSTLIHETLGMAVLDSACTKTVAGRIWLESFLETLKEEDRQSVETLPSKTKFVFGDGVEVTSKNAVKFPVCIGKTKALVEANVVENDIPLLLSRASMKRAQMILDFNHDTVNAFGEQIKLGCTSSGHYCMPLTNLLLDDGNTKNIVLHSTANVRDMSAAEMKVKALKLHKQFSHASKEKLCKLVKDSKDFNDDVFLEAIRECCDSCEICQKFKRQPLRPVVGLPLADNFNQVVCMDLKEHIHNESWIFHLIDTATRYSAACLINTKRQDEIISKIYLKWITYFGCPRKFLTDNGGEFSNESFREMNEKLNVETATTAAESPFSNGMVERHNLVIYEAMQKTMQDEKCAPEVALAWAVSAKNSLHNHGGFSPNQLVFGHNVNMPSVLIDELPALESVTSNDVIRNNMNALHKARENFIQAEASEKLRRALRHNVRSYADERYVTGDKVYYKRKNFKGWKGPGVVLGQDGQFVLIRHGGAYFRMHPCQLMKIKGSNSEEDKDKKNTTAKEESNPAKDKAKMNKPDKKGRTAFHLPDLDEDRNHDVEQNGADTEENVEQNAAEAMPPLDDELEENAAIDQREEFMNSSTKPKRNSSIRFKLMESNEWKEAKVISYQPKQTGKYQNWINIHVTGQEDPICVNWDQVYVWDALPEIENVILMTAEQEMSQKVVDAKEREVNHLIENNVFEVVPSKEHQPIVSSRWVITEKVSADGQKKMKARLVARGFEEDSSELTTDSPTCGRESLRMVFTVAAMMEWDLHSIDITSAFLQGEAIDRELYLKPPKDICSSNNVWRLKRCIYGLNDAPRCWYERVKKVLVDIGATISTYDNAMFEWHDVSGSLFGILVSHVDDFVFCGNAKFHRDVISKLEATFKVSMHVKGTFKYLGLNIVQDRNGITVNQEKYIPSVKEIHVNKSRSARRTDALNDEEKVELKRLSGQMMWVASQTRPDLSFETCIMSNAGKKGSVKDLHEANKAVSKMKMEKVEIKFPNLGCPKKLSIETYSDATYASLNDGSSQGAFIVFLRGDNGLLAPISWQSKKLNRVTKSPLASETLALSESADAGFLVSALTQEIFGLPHLPRVECNTDNKSLAETLRTSTIITDRRLRVDVARIREMVRENEITVTWIPGEQQLADSLTKRGASTRRLLEVLRNSTTEA